jgi:hypothetical protein
VTFSPVWFSPVFILLYITNHRPPLLTFFYSDIIKTSSSPLSIIFRSGTCVHFEIQQIPCCSRFFGSVFFGVFKYTCVWYNRTSCLWYIWWPDSLGLEIVKFQSFSRGSGSVSRYTDTVKDCEDRVTGDNVFDSLPSWLRVTSLCYLPIVLISIPSFRHPISFGLLWRDKVRVNRILTYECRCDERLRSTGDGSTRLTCTGLCGGLEHLKIETRLRDERFQIVKGERSLWRDHPPSIEKRKKSGWFSQRRILTKLLFRKRSEFGQFPPRSLKKSFFQGLESKFLFMNKLEKIPCSRVHERFMNMFKFFSWFFFFGEHVHEQDTLFMNCSWTCSNFRTKFEQNLNKLNLNKLMNMFMNN